MAITRNDIIKSLCETGNFSRERSKELLKTMIAIIEQSLAEGEQVKISGFGTFTPKKRKPRRGRNPKTGEEVKIPSHLTVVFKASIHLKRRVEKKRS